MGLHLNQQAPPFTLFNTDKKEVSLSDFKGSNVVLLFFPLAFTGTCTKELCNIRDNHRLYNDLNATVSGISVDSLFTLARFKADQSLNFQLLSDFNRTASAAYDCLYDEFIHGMKGVSKRAAFVLDREGVVKYAEVIENASNEPNYDAIRSQLEALNHLC